MHAAGSKEEAGCNIISKQQIKEFADAEADIILLLAPGIIPAIIFVKDRISYIHSLKKLSLTDVKNLMSFGVVIKGKCHT